MGLYLRAAHGRRSPAQRPGGAGLRRDGDPGGEDPAGGAQLRLRLAPPLPAGRQGHLNLQPVRHRAGRRHSAAIRFDSQAQSPWFRYMDENGTEHEVWFEDARSIRAKLALVPRYGLSGVGYWNLMRSFPQNWRVLNALYDILDP